MNKYEFGSIQVPGFVQPKISAVQSAHNTEKLSMTNTQNVTELQPRMTREQLIDAARKAALSFRQLIAAL